MGSIDRHGDRWRVRYQAEGRRISRSGFATRAEARAWLAQAEVDLAGGRHVDPRSGRLLFRQYEGLWLSGLLAEASTKDRTKSRINAQLLPAFGTRRLDEIRREDVRAWVAALAERYRPTYVRSCLVTLRSILQEAVDSGRLPQNPAAGVSSPTLRAEERRFLTAEEVEALAGAIEPRFRNLVLLAAYSGLRWGELTGLRIENLDLLRGRVTVAEVLARGEAGRRYVKAFPKSAAGRRTVGLPQAVTEGLRTHVETYGVGEGGLVFSTERGRPLRHADWNEVHFGPAVLRAGLGGPARPTFHSLRHTHAALLIAQGTHAKAVQRRLGHASIRTTLDTYGHLYEEHEAEITDGLEQALAQARTETAV